MTAKTFALIGSLVWSGTCAADVAVAVYFGKGIAADTDVQLREPPDADLTFSDVAWEDRSFRAPIYYGLRFNYWFDASRDNGIAVDFTHAKMYADVGQRVDVTGHRGGAAVAAQEPLSDTFSNLAFSHGYNLLTLNALHRWRSGVAEAAVRPYAGAGIGIAYPHAEVTTASRHVDEFQLAGLVYQGLLGISYQTHSAIEWFAEYKLSRGDLDVDLGSDGRLEVKPVTHHLAVGAAFDLK